MEEDLQQKGRRVLWLDPAFQAGRPTTQSLFLALPAMLDKGWQIHLWCLEHDALDARVNVRRLPRARFLRLLEPLWFWFLAWMQLSWRRFRGERWDIVHTTGPDIPGADVMSLHFYNRIWIRMLWRQRNRSFKENLRLLHTVVGVIQETLTLGSKKWRVVLPVSQGLAGRIRPHLAADKKIRVLPNVLNESRFHPGVRQLHRQQMRGQIQASENDYVFIFVSTGHYVRKGLWTALAALQTCREAAQADGGLNLRFLIVGASERAQAQLIPRLDREVPDWRDWVHLEPPTPEVQRWYAAADAFLFPSLYETFSLVALEAAACGLPLLLTPFDGQEMYLRDGVNGCLLPWDAPGMASRISHFLRAGRHGIKPGPAAFVDALGYAKVLDQTYSELVLVR